VDLREALRRALPDTNVRVSGFGFDLFDEADENPPRRSTPQGGAATQAPAATAAAIGQLSGSAERSVKEQEEEVCVEVLRKRGANLKSDEEGRRALRSGVARSFPFLWNSHRNDGGRHVAMASSP